MKMNVHVESIVLLRLLFPSWAKFFAGIFDAIPQTSVGLHQLMLQRIQYISVVVKSEKSYKNKDRVLVKTLTAFSFTDLGSERLFTKIKLWSISPCSCSSSTPRKI